METMLHGSQCYTLFKEAFHIYGSFFETNKDEEAFRDILLHPETGLNVVIVTHPVTLERFVVLNNPSCDVSMFLNLYTRIFIWRWECGSVEVRSRNSLGTFEEHGHRVWQKYITPGQLSQKSRHLVTAVTPAVLPKKMAARRQHFSREEVIEQKAAVVAAAVKLRLQVCHSLSPYPQKWLLYLLFLYTK